MTLIRLGPATLNRSRFALSPLAETISALTALQRSDIGVADRVGFARRRELFLTWTKDDPTARGLFALCGATKFLPDLVAPPPTDMSTRIEDELVRVATWTNAATRLTLEEATAHSWVPQELSWAGQPDLAAQIARVLAEAWALFVEPDWPRRRAILERDVMFRAGILATRGWHDAIDGMAPKLQWQGDDAIQFSTQTHPDRVVGDEGLVLVPHTGTKAQWTCEAPPRFALVYPARGTGVVAERPNNALNTLLGEGRARVLLELQCAATSTQLAATLGLSLGTISGHLAVLRRTGIVSGARDRHAVYYNLTAAGQQLVDTLNGAPSPRE